MVVVVSEVHGWVAGSDLNRLRQRHLVLVLRSDSMVGVRKRWLESLIVHRIVHVVGWMTIGTRDSVEIERRIGFGLVFVPLIRVRRRRCVTQHGERRTEQLRRSRDR